MTDTTQEPGRPVAGQLGRLPKRQGDEKFAIRWAHEYLAAPLPAPVYPIDLRGQAGPGDMWGNNTDGDCGEAGLLFLRLYTAARAGTTPLPSWTSQQAIDEYLAYTGGQDSGVVLADFLLWLYRRGEILGFAPAPHDDRATCDSLMQEFQTPLYSGVNLTGQDQADFGVRPWGSEGATPDPSLGHCVAKVFTDGTHVEKWRTWAAFQDALLTWGEACLDEAWLVITTEEQKAQFAPQLWADLDALPGATGSAPSAPVPDPPAPDPGPTPAPPAPPLPPTPGPDEWQQLLALLEELLAFIEGTGALAIGHRSGPDLHRRVREFLDRL